MGSLSAWLKAFLSGAVARMAPARRLRARHYAPLLGLLLAIFVLGAPSASFAQAPNVNATLDDNVPAGTYKQNGATIDYTIVITNSGGDAAAVTLTDPTPANTTFVAGSLHASPLAFADSYTAVGNTKLYVGTTAPAGEPARVVAGPTLLNNDTISTSPDTIVLTGGTSATTLGGSVTVNTDGTFTYTPPVGFTGTDTFTYAIHNSADATLADTGSVSIAVSNVVWYVNNSVGIVNGNGTSASPFTTLASLNGAGGVGDSDGPNDFIYVYRGSGAAYTGGLPLESGQMLTSETSPLMVGGNTLRAAQAVPFPILSHNTGSTVLLSTNNIIDGFNITNSNGNGISGSAIGAAQIEEITVSVTGGIALNAITSGTLTVTGTANTLNSTNNTALNVNTVTIGGPGLTFQSISAGAGANNGINLVSTGAGGLTVTGFDGGDAGTDPDPGSGGTIAGKTGGDGSTTAGIGVFLNNASNVSLNGMQLNGFSNYAIRGISVAGFSLSNSVINGVSGDSTTADANGADAGGEGAIRFFNVTGTNTITSTSIEGGFEDNIHVFNNTGTGVFTVFGSTVKNNDLTNGNDGVFGQADATANLTIKVVNSTLQRNRGDHVNTTQSGSAVIHTVVTGNTMTRNGTIGEPFDLATTAGGTVTLTTGANFSGTSTFNVSENNITGAKTAPININNASLSSTAGANFSGTIHDNIIGKAGAVGSGGGDGDGIDITANGNATITVNITDNKVRQWKLLGISLIARDGNAGINATITGNTVGEPSNTTDSGQAIILNSGPAGTEAGTSNVTIGGAGTLANSFPGPFTAGISPLRVRARGLTTVILPGYGGGSTDVTAVANFLSPKNNNVFTTAQVQGSGEFTNGPATPSGAAPTLLLGAGGVESTPAAFRQTTLTGAQPTLPAAQSTLVDAGLTQADLDATVAAALTRWSAAGLTGEQIARLRSLRFEVTALGDLHLGEASGNRIRIDRKAAGNGWFIDPTPMDDAEFADADAGTRRYTDPAGAPAGRIDLLTAVMHEMGHRLGLGDSYHERDRDAVMYGFLTKGERRLPTPRDAVAAKVSGALQARSQ